MTKGRTMDAAVNRDQLSISILEAITEGLILDEYVHNDSGASNGVRDAVTTIAWDGGIYDLRLQFVRDEV